MPAARTPSSGGVLLLLPLLLRPCSQICQAARCLPRLSEQQAPSAAPVPPAGRCSAPVGGRSPGLCRSCKHNVKAAVENKSKRRNSYKQNTYYQHHAAITSPEHTSAMMHTRMPPKDCITACHTLCSHLCAITSSTRPLSLPASALVNCRRLC